MPGGRTVKGKELPIKRPTPGEIIEDIIDNPEKNLEIIYRDVCINKKAKERLEQTVGRKFLKTVYGGDTGLKIKKMYPTLRMLHIQSSVGNQIIPDLMEAGALPIEFFYYMDIFQNIAQNIPILLSLNMTEKLVNSNNRHIKDSIDEQDLLVAEIVFYQEFCNDIPSIVGGLEDGHPLVKFIKWTGIMFNNHNLNLRHDRNKILGRCAKDIYAQKQESLCKQLRKAYDDNQSPH